MRVVGWVCLILLAAACHTTLEGRLKAGFPGKDTIVSRYEVPYAQVYEAAKAVLKDTGTLVSDDQVSKVLRARVDTNTIWVKLDDSEPRITTMSVEARSSGGVANIELASEIDKRIYGRLITR
jgi:hypothetical protein